MPSMAEALAASGLSLKVMTEPPSLTRASLCTCLRSKCKDWPGCGSSAARDERGSAEHERPGAGCRENVAGHGHADHTRQSSRRVRQAHQRGDPADDPDAIPYSERGPASIETVASFGQICPRLVRSSAIGTWYASDFPDAVPVDTTHGSSALTTFASNVLPLTA